MRNITGKILSLSSSRELFSKKEKPSAENPGTPRNGKLYLYSVKLAGKGMREREKSEKREEENIGYLFNSILT